MTTKNPGGEILQAIGIILCFAAGLFLITCLFGCLIQKDSQPESHWEHHIKEEPTEQLCIWAETTAEYEELLGSHEEGYITEIDGELMMFNGRWINKYWLMVEA